MPGSVFPDHSHGCDKKDAIISGRFMFRAEGEEVSSVMCPCALTCSSCPNT